ncbi:hypothetical protein J2Z53_000521 [Clostridium moniliforme]|uniref:Uncharacterized protein n=1 Tax=Clostridium moniliforme TaxID=39489 RepID=A0ABS4EY74_9CLOT|nr:hypothetical protein [Clostridium moniliforme]MBP1888942.1 hypothetical protein [Clostridium moniliforme]
MSIKKLNKRIKNRKLLLNILLKFISPSNKFIIKLSQNLDKDISRYQVFMYKLHLKKLKRRNTIKSLAA